MKKVVNIFFWVTIISVFVLGIFEPKISYIPFYILGGVAFVLAFISFINPPKI